MNVIALSSVSLVGTSCWQRNHHGCGIMFHCIIYHCGEDYAQRSSHREVVMMLERLREWWGARMEALAVRWEEDLAFRHALSFLLTAITLAGLGICYVTVVLVIHHVQSGDDGKVIVLGADTNPVNYPLPILTPYPMGDLPPPLAVATSIIAEATPTPQPSPTALPTPTPSTANCPSPTGQPQLSGRTVLDATLPAPLIAGCPAELVIQAQTQFNAPVAVTLTFGTIDPTGCTVTLNGATDASGSATLAFTVPGTSCFRGSIITSGQIVVGGDATANANFLAEG
jgi:hypothetical protein